jgi:hypothetical protein
VASLSACDFAAIGTGDFAPFAAADHHRAMRAVVNVSAMGAGRRSSSGTDNRIMSAAAVNLSAVRSVPDVALAGSILTRPSGWLAVGE